MEEPHPQPPPPPPAPQPLDDEPDAKKPKITSDDDDDDDEMAAPSTTAGPVRKPRYKRRKVAIFFAYCGVGYQGMQKNPGAKTIEGDLEEALYHSGAVPDHDRGVPRRYDWARSARTDKGVSAVGQVVSGRFYVDPPGFVERLNSNLPAQIRIFGYKRVTASFSAKKFCDRRRYVYLIPVFALDPCAHRDRESVLASLGSGNELVKCLECSERGRKVVGAVGRGGVGGNSLSDISSNNMDASVEPVAGEVVDTSVSNVEGENSNSESIVEGNGSELEAKSRGDVLEKIDASVRSDVKLEDVVALDNATTEKADSILVEGDNALQNEGNVGNGDDMNPERVSLEEADKEDKDEGRFCYGEKERERFNSILKYYIGCHNFHNFTTRTKAEDPSARRYIISFEAKTTVMVDGIEFVKCEVVGQSFMLHQIRKMIGLAVAIMRNCAPESLIETAFRTDTRINVPTAPEVGLYLDECLFSSYNQKWKDTHEELSMKSYEEAAEEFKMKHIYSHIASMEHKEGVVGLWLHSLNHRNYPDLRPTSNGTDTIHEELAEVVSVAE